MVDRFITGSFLTLGREELMWSSSDSTRSQPLTMPVSSQWGHSWLLRTLGWGRFCAFVHPGAEW